MSTLEISWNADLDDSLGVALKALAFVRSDQPRFHRFLSDAGLARADVERWPPRNQDLAALLDFLIADEAALQAFSRRADLRPEAAYEARRLLRCPPHNEAN